MDNAPVHPAGLKSNDGNIVAIFLPPCTTALLQPMDQSIIYSFKKMYMRTIILNIKASEGKEGANKDSIVENIKRFNIRQCIQYVFESWNLIPSSILRNSWKKMQN